MRNLGYIIIVFVCMVFTSCFGEKDIWYTETSALDGRYVVATTCAEYPDDDTSIEDGNEVMIYNSAANVKDEIWIETHVAGQAVKGKFKITGDASDFKGVDAEVKNISSGTFLFKTDKGMVLFKTSFRATAAGLLNDGIQLYTRVKLIEGKVIPKGATTIGGNVSDSVYIKTLMHHDYIKYISYELPKGAWKDPSVPEFGWKVKDGSNTPADADGNDETWTLAGYRYTGFSEDM